jgi:hypothetical protein
MTAGAAEGAAENVTRRDIDGALPSIQTFYSKQAILQTFFTNGIDILI